MLRRSLPAPSTIAAATAATAAMVTAATLAAAVPAGAAPAAGPTAAAAAPKPTPVVLVNTVNDRCADILGLRKGKLGERVEQWYCRPGSYDNQQFLMWRTGRVGTATRFMLQHGKGGLCVDLPGTKSVARGTALRLAPCRSTDNQHFLSLPVEGADGAGFLIHEASKLCVDVTGTRSKSPRRALVLNRCNAKDDHLWRIVAPADAPVHPDPRARKAKPVVRIS